MPATTLRDVSDPAIAEKGYAKPEVLVSTAWLANHLVTYSLALEPGQDIMTGSFTKPTPIAKGDRWESSFSGVGTVSATFA